MIRKSVYAFIILSVLFHFVFYGGMTLLPSLPQFSNSEEIEVTVLDENPAEKTSAKPESLLAKQIVTQEQRVNDEIDEKAKYLSQFNQKVLKETRAEQAGKFNNQPRPGVPAQKPAPQQQVKAEKEKSKSQGFEVYENTGGEVSLNPFKPNFKPRPVIESQAATNQGAAGAPSQTDDYLKDTQKGLQTLLSTREFVYYSYYNRIKEKVQQHWEPNLREKVRKLFVQGRGLASSQDRITQVLITLDSNGNLIRIQVVTASGITDLDQAAVDAFRAAAPFPNPPKGIVEEDGTVKINWAFVLEA